MDTKYYDMLLQDNKNLVKIIEKKIGKEILVEIDTSRVDILACDIEDFEPKILIPRGDYFPDSSVTHELLHLERFCVKDVPILCTCNDNFGSEEENNLTLLDNNLEHLIIVPEEIKLRPDRYNSWVDKINSKLVYFENMIANGQPACFNPLLYWVFISQSFNNSEPYTRIVNILSNFNIIELADNFLSEINPIINCKRDLVNVCLSHIGVPRNNICLEYYDFNDNSKRKKSLV